MNELLSVIIPVYNSFKYLDRCLYSVSKQTYSNLEIIIIDDGATDHSSDIIQNFCKKDDRFKHYYTQNQGQSSARNLGLSKAKGSLIAFLDSDDFIDSDMYLTLIKNLEGTNASISICGYYKYLQSENKSIIPKHDNKVTILTPEEAKIMLYTSEMESYVWNKIYRREVFDDITFPKNTNHEEIYIMYKLFSKASKIVYQDTPKYYFVQRESSITADKIKENSVDLLNGLITRYKSARDEVDLEVRKKMLADIYSEYVEQNTKDDRENQLFFVKNLLFIEGIDFRSYLSPLKRKQLKLRKLGIKYNKQFKIINIVRKK